MKNICITVDRTTILTRAGGRLNRIEYFFWNGSNLQKKYYNFSGRRVLIIPALASELLCNLHLKRKEL